MCTVCNESESESDGGCYYTDVIVGGEDTIKTVCDAKRGTICPPPSLSLPSFPHSLLPASLALFLYTYITHHTYITTHTHTHTHTHTLQVGSMVVYLCSEDARQVTGSTLTIDGGWTTR